MKGEVYNQSTWIALKAASYYYEQNKTLKEVARLLNVSESTVSRLIQRAKKEQIVEFVIRDPYKLCLDLEYRLLEKFDLKEVIIANASSDPEENKKRVALEGARYLQREVTSRDKLGIAWGGTMYYLVHYLNPCQRTDTSFVTLHGSLSCCDYELDVHNLVSRMSMAFGGNYYSLSSAGLFDSREDLQTIKQDANVRRIFSLFEQLTISVSGMGSFYPELDSPLSRLAYLKPEELADLRDKGVYGDIILRFFDCQGKELDSDIRDRTLAIDIQTYKKIPRKILVVSGVQKAKSLVAALKGGLVDVLIVDSKLAQAILS
ncbi:MAG TPA: sugar-binding domain-containing protein [Syntrophomonadaceae bacterium]|nr:sugar-binding domain-containing protein [Syntrophomonadaceae bacterium]HRX20613.1 sugar-binding domain-containing protein [Syntrophomonadaceae bacterium]